MLDSVSSTSRDRPLLESLEPRLLLDGLSEAQAVQLFNVSPALFVENQGQWAEESVRFVHNGSGANVAMTDSGPVFQVFREVVGEGGEETPEHSLDGPLLFDHFEHEPPETEMLQFSASFLGANTVTPVGLDRSEAYFNYFVGGEENWHSEVPAYETVAYSGLYDGIDLYTWGQRDSLKYEFHVAPGADWSAIQVHYEGVEGLSLAEDGSLVVGLGDGWGQVTDDAPIIYQVVDGERVEVAGAFSLLDSDTYTFQVTGPYDPSRELVIDPDLVWSTYLGGSDRDYGWGIAVDSFGNALVTGRTWSAGWTSGGFDTSYEGDPSFASGYSEAFVAKLSPTGGHVWSTYLGGSRQDEGRGVAVDAAGNVLVTGNTSSAGWVSGGFDTSYDDLMDSYEAFVAKLSPGGGHVWSTYLGGSSRDEGFGIAVDAFGNALITGRTWSADWTSGGFDTSYEGDLRLSDAFVAKLSPAGGHVWSTYLGGSEQEIGFGIAVDAAGNTIVTGETCFWTGGVSRSDAFVTKLSPAGGHVWSTCLGGSECESGSGIAVDAAGNVLVAGVTQSAGWTRGGWDTSYGGRADGFALKLSPAGGHVWSTYLGGSDTDYGYGIAVDAAGNTLVTGYTRSAGWVSGGFDTSFNGDWDAFVAKLSPAGGHVWSTYLGGSAWDWGYGIAADPSGNALVTSLTFSAGLTRGGFDTSLDGESDAFVAKIGGGAALPDLAVSEADVLLSPEGEAQRVIATVHNHGSLGAANVPVRFRDLGTGTTVGTETIASIGSFDSETCSVLWTPTGPGARIEVKVDPLNLIQEASETNNTAEAVCGPVGKVKEVAAAWDGDGAADTFGRFVSGVDLWNTFTASVLDPDGSADIDYVDFTLGSLGTVTDSDPFGGWTAEFNLGELAGDTTLEVVAYDTGGQPSEPWTGTVHVVPFPAWLGEADSEDYFAGGYYHLNGFFPEELDVTHTMPEDWWIIGGKESGFRLGVELGVTAGLVTDADVPVDHEFVFEAKVLDHELFGFGGDPFSFSIGNHVMLSFSALADGEDLSLTGLSAELDVNAFPLYEGSAVGPSMTVIVPVGFIPIALTVSSGVNFGLTVDAELNLGWDVVHGELEVLPGSYLQPNVTAEPYLFGGVGIPLLNAGLEVGGELGLHYRGEYIGPMVYEDYLWGSFALNFRLVATAGEKWTLAEWTVPGEGEDPWVFGDPPPGGMMAAWTLEGDGEAVLLPEPSVAADGSGNVLLARVVDSDVDPDDVEADIFYATRDAGGTWTALSPVASETTIDSDPVVAFDGAGGAVASWVANPTDPESVDPEAWDAYLAEQEIHSAYWNGTAWGPVQAVTADERMDGPPEIAFHDGQGLMVWEHATTADSTDPDAYEIHYAVWDDATHTWGSPQALTSDSEGDWAPQVAFGPGGEAIAVWVHDDHSDPTTAHLHYATWDGAGWSTPAAVPLGSTAGVREPRLAFDSGGDALLAWIGNEGEEDILYTATWDHGTGTWAAPEAVAGTPWFIEGLDLAISPTDTAKVVWHGWDGQHDLFSTVRDLGGSDGWTPPARMTENADGEWMVSTAFDAVGVPVTVWANEAVTTAFGEGAEGVELALAPDLAVTEIVVDAFQPVQGHEARLYAEVANDGWDGAEATTLTFYLGDPDDGGTALGGPVDVEALAVGDATTVMSEVFDLPAGTNDYYAVVELVADEIDEANNTTSTTLESLPPDEDGPQVVLELPEGAVLREGVNTLGLTFDEPVTWLGEAHISLVEATEGVTPPDHVYLSPDGQSATLIFEGGLPPAGAADTYTFRVLDNVTDGAGNALDGNADNTPGGDYEVAFTVAIDGDLQVDGKVDRDDLAVFLGAFDTPEPGAADLDQDGDCDRDDLAIFLGAYGNELAEPVGQAMSLAVEPLGVEALDQGLGSGSLLSANLGLASPLNAGPTSSSVDGQDVAQPTDPGSMNLLDLGLSARLPESESASKGLSLRDPGDESSQEIWPRLLASEDEEESEEWGLGAVLEEMEALEVL